MAAPFSQLEIRRRNAASQAAAAKLTATRMPVIVVRDDGSELATTLRMLPWKLGHGAYVCSVEGISGAYDCSRVRPA